MVKKKVNIGDNKKITKLALEGITISLITNFKPSAKACKKPNIPVRLGPFLLCTLLITLRSINVKNAIQSKINTILTKKNASFSINKYNI